VWRPFLLGPIFVAQGWNDSPFNVYPAKGRYMWRDLERICAALDLPLRRPSRFPRNAVLAARIGCACPDALWLPDFVRRMYAANFAEDCEIGDEEVVTDILRAQTERAKALGIFGAPTFVCGEELFWGQDRMEQAIDRARAAA
jgi:2-hydroxychromene-2-carboxylate isomerase